MRSGTGRCSPRVAMLTSTRQFITADDWRRLRDGDHQPVRHAVSHAVRLPGRGGRRGAIAGFGLKVFVEGAFGPAKEATLAPGQARRWTVACSLALSKSQAARAVEAWLDRPTPLARSQPDYQSWFRPVSELECGRPAAGGRCGVSLVPGAQEHAAPEAMRLRRPVVSVGRGSKMTLDAGPRKGGIHYSCSRSARLHCWKGAGIPDAREGLGAGSGGKPDR